MRFQLTDIELENKADQLKKDLAEFYNISIEDAHDFLMGKGLPKEVAERIENGNIK